VIEIVLVKCREDEREEFFGEGRDGHSRSL